METVKYFGIYTHNNTVAGECQPFIHCFFTDFVLFRKTCRHPGAHRKIHISHAVTKLIRAVLDSLFERFQTDFFDSRIGRDHPDRSDNLPVRTEHRPANPDRVLDIIPIGDRKPLLADLREIEKQVGRINDRVVCQPLEPMLNIILQISLCLVGKQRFPECASV